LSIFQTSPRRTRTAISSRCRLFAQVVRLPPFGQDPIFLLLLY
jgi:hypothetical protein